MTTSPQPSASRGPARRIGTESAPTTIPRRRRLRLVGVVVAVVGLLGVAACSGSGSSSGSGGGGSEAVNGVSAGSSAAGSGAAPAADAMGAGKDFSAQSQVDDISLETRAIIKTASISLESSDVGSVVSKIEGLALTSGGRIASENTSTNGHGQPVESKIELLVPQQRFDDATSTIPTYGTLVDSSESQQDVTAKLADVTSRVQSADAAIDQLRTLYSRATKLGDVILLERELSEREADLEALQAQERALRAETTMSTILITVTKTPQNGAVTTSEHHAGFVSGIKKGWDAMVTSLIALSHGLGLVLPLALLILLVALAVWMLVRRFVPMRREPEAVQSTD